MLADFKVNRCTRRCHELGRPLRDGEWYYSVVIEQGDDLIRRDYSAETWKGPPEGAVGWWKGRMPVAGTRKLVLAPDPVLVDLLRGLGDSEDRRAVRYLLALTLLHRRVLTAVDAPGTEPPPLSASAVSSTLAGEVATPSGDSPSAPAKLLRLRVNADGSEIDIMECSISRQQVDQLQASLQELLYCEATE